MVKKLKWIKKSILNNKIEKNNQKMKKIKGAKKP
jgi:hypothetical protein